MARDDAGQPLFDFARLAQKLDAVKREAGIAWATNQPEGSAFVERACIGSLCLKNLDTAALWPSLCLGQEQMLSTAGESGALSRGAGVADGIG